MPFLICLYIIAFIDRANVGYAALEMTQDLGFDAEVLGFGAGIFFIGYFLLEIPGTLLVEKWSARKWLARIIISWGILATLTGFIQTSTQFYIVRFLLGLGEAGFFPGVIVYLSHWVRYQDRAKAVAMFMTAIPISYMIGAPVSGLILNVDWLGWAGWRWVFILEGIPALVLGVVTLFYLTDRPRQAGWLENDEIDWIEGELERERAERKAVRAYRVGEALRNRNVVLLALAYFCGVTSAYGINIWLPTILKDQFHYSSFQTSLLSAVPYCAGFTVMLVAGWSSDRRNERRWHTAVALLAVSFGLFLSTLVSGNIYLTILAFSIAAAGLYSYLPVFWSLPAIFLTETAAAACVGMINSVGNLGGFAGPYIVGYLSKTTGSFYGGIIYLSCSAFAAALLILAVHKTHSPTAASRN
jgi:D-galactonate transporter